MLEYDDTLTVCPHCGYESGHVNTDDGRMKPGSLLSGRYLTGNVFYTTKSSFSYIALDGSLNKKVAVTEYFPSGMLRRTDGRKKTECTGDEDILAGNIEKVVSRASSLREFNYYDSVTDIYDVFEENGTAYVVTEFPDGITLDNAIKSGRTFDYAETVSTVTPLLRALSGLHSAGHFHGNINPESLMLCKNGKLKLFDFGTGFFDTDELQSGFAPAEQYGSSEPAGAAADIYSVCAVMYYMLTGNVPSDSRLRNTPYDNFVPLCGIADIPPYAEDALMKGMSVSPEDRPDSISELTSALTGGSEEYPEGGSPEAFVPEGAKTPLPGNKKAMTAAIAIACAGLLIIAVAAILIIPKIKKNTEPESSALTTVTKTERVTGAENIMLPSEIRQKFSEYFDSEEFEEKYPGALAIKRRNIDLYPEDKAVPGGVTTFDSARSTTHFFDLDGDGNDECILVLDTSGVQRYVEIYVFDIDKEGNIINTGEIGYESGKDEEIYLCTAKGDQSTSYYFLRYTENSSASSENPLSFEILCCDTEKMFCAASGGAYKNGRSSTGTEINGGDYCYTGLSFAPDGSIWNTGNPAGVKSLYAYGSNYKVSSADDYNVTDKDTFSLIWKKNVESATKKIALKTMEIVNNTVYVSAAFPGLELSGKEIELSWHIGAETKSFLYTANGSKIIYSEEMTTKDFSSDYRVELWYGSRRYCYCDISLGANGPVYKMSQTELAKLPDVTGLVREEAVRQVKDAGFTNVTLVRGTRLGLVQVVGNLYRIQKMSEEKNEYYPKDTEIKLYFYYI
jgi:serine/threonine protein kinase